MVLDSMWVLVEMVELIFLVDSISLLANKQTQTRNNTMKEHT
jgi:hypothetical protein